MKRDGDLGFSEKKQREESRPTLIANLDQSFERPKGGFNQNGGPVSSLALL